MSTSQTAPKPHSAEFFGESRDFWWNLDFLELMAKRLQWERVQTVLDVGCGIGHWGQLLSRVLPPTVRITGVDREPLWVSRASERAAAGGAGARFHYLPGDAGALPFSEPQFDLVTCQTVLIHLSDPRAALKEMLRVLKPGGQLLIAEPNNLANRLMGGSLFGKQSVEAVLESIEFGLRLERGKEALGLGYNSLGDLIPGYLAELGVEQIRVYLSDKALPLFPPYLRPEQQSLLRQLREWKDRKFVGWDRDETWRYYIAGGGDPARFETFYQSLLQSGAEMLQAVEASTYHSAGGAVMYLIAGQKI